MRALSLSQLIKLNQSLNFLGVGMKYIDVVIVDVGSSRYAYMHGRGLIVGFVL